MKLGYARLSTHDQNASMQVQALVGAGVAKDRVFIDEMSGAKSARERPQMAKLLEYARDGDEIFVWPVDRLGRSWATSSTPSTTSPPAGSGCIRSWMAWIRPHPMAGYSWPSLPAWHTTNGN